MTVLKPNY